MRHMLSSYGKIASAPREIVGALWRDGRAAEGACLENMFGSHQRGFESHSLRSPSSSSDDFSFYDKSDLPALVKSTVPGKSLLGKIWGGARVVEWGRLLSGYRGEIFGRRFESCPPR